MIWLLPSSTLILQMQYKRWHKQSTSISNLSSQNSFLSEKQKKYSHMYTQVCTIILIRDFQSYHTPLVSIPLKYPPLKKIHLFQIS